MKGAAVFMPGVLVLSEHGYPERGPGSALTASPPQPKLVPALSQWSSMATRQATVLRAATHVAAWIPFLAAVARSLGDAWRVVGDGASIALRSWDALTAHGPLVGQATRLARGLWDLGPLQYWLLAAPVHLDPGRGVLWGAALWCMAAASVAIEAAWSVLGEFGGFVASGAILGVIAWMPGVAVRPYWNPWFGMMFFLAALATGWAVISGRRWWWPVLVITASVAAQAHLMFAIASAALVLLALVVGLADGFGAKTGYRWAVTGFIAGIACWIAPLIQQFTGRVGNMTALIHHSGTGQRTGLTFALKALTASTQPAPLWWASSQSFRRLDIARLIDGRSAGFALACLAVTAAAMLLAALWLRSRPLAGLASISLLTTAAELVTFSSIPVKDHGFALSYLIIIMFPVGLLTWLTVGSTSVLMVRQLANRRRAAGPAERRHDEESAVHALPRRAVRIAGAAAVPLIVVASWPAVAQQASASPQAAQLGSAVRVASRLIERALPGQPVALSVRGANSQFQRRLTLSLVWALSADGYRPKTSPMCAIELGPQYVFQGQPLPHVTVLVHSGRISVGITKVAAERPGAVR